MPKPSCLQLVRTLLIVILCVSGMKANAAERKVALLLGNSSYAHVTRLPNPVNDTRLVGEALKNLGFEVTVLTDATRASTERALLEFSRKSSGADVALVFYAGHGIQYEGKNYLLPVDASLDNELALRLESVDVDLILGAMSSARTRLLFLDACRNNPFTNRLQLSGGSRSVSRGLARIEASASGTLIAFSTSPDDVASDGNGENSPFSASLAKFLATPGLEIRQVLTRVRAAVIAETAGRQTPWENSSLLGDLYLSGTSAETASTPSPPQPASTEDVVWEQALQDGSIESLTAYVEAFPASKWRPSAERLIAGLQSAQSAEHTVPTRPTRDALREAFVGRWELATGVDGFMWVGCYPRAFDASNRNFERLLAADLIRPEDDPIGLPPSTFEYKEPAARMFVTGDEMRILRKGFANWDVEKAKNCVWKRAED